MDKKRLVIFVICLYLSIDVYGQNSLSISTPMIWSNVEVKDNWTPATAPHYREYRSGSAFGYGVNLGYSFRPKFLIKDKRFSLNIGVGYFEQRFDLVRPFNYNSTSYVIFYTDQYSYRCFQGNIGFTYNYELHHKLFFVSNFSYSALKSFQQIYTPGHAGFSTQINRNQLDFGKMLFLSVGLNKYLGERFSIGLHLLAPVYSRWRNDIIFNDDPTTFYRPKFSLGSSLSISYHFKEKQ